MEVRELAGAPDMRILFARAGVGMIPGSSLLPFLGGGGSSGEIPELALSLSGVAADRDRLSAYQRVCAFAVGEVLPATYPHMLAFPLQLALMTDPSFPFPAIGLVHIANRIVQKRPVRAGEQLSLRVWATPLEPHPRGQQFALRSQARVGKELVWEETSTNLRRGGDASRAVPGGPAGPSEIPSSAALSATGTWRLPGDLGRRYAGVSGDYNPIHVHPLTARLFGFPRAIAHGMWTKARCLAALAPRLPDAFAVEVAFRKPILLPAEVTFALGPEGNADRLFGVRDAERDTPHVDGRLSPG